MNVSKLLLMSGLLLTGATANAALVDGVRQRPVPAKTALQYNQASYLFNIGSGQFFKGANDWNTRASVGDAGYKVWIRQHLDDTGAFDGKTVTLLDSVETKKQKLLTWGAANGDAWVDLNNQADTLWTLTAMDNGIYRISLSTLNANVAAGAEGFTVDDNMYLGTKKNEPSNTRLYWNVAPDTANVDWYFVTVEDAQAFATQIQQYNKAEELRAVIAEAQTAGVADLSAAQAAYADESQTVEQLEKAIADVKAAIARVDENNTTAANPKDYTTFITNPSYDSNSNTGWSGTAPAFQSYTDAEFYAKTYNYYQVVKNLPRGVYALSVQAFYRAGYSGNSYDNYVNDANHHAKLFAVADGDTTTANIVNPVAEAVTEKIGVGNESELTTDKNATQWAAGTKIYVPNDMQSAAAYFQAGKYNNVVYVEVKSDSLVIGLNKTTTLDGDWTLFDNWTLKYYGKHEDAYTMALNNVKANAPKFANVTEETLITQGMIDSYKALLDGYTTASTWDEVKAAQEAIDAQAEAINANMAAWKAYQAAIDKAQNQVLNDMAGEYVDLLADYISDEAESNIEALELTTEQLTAETEKLNTMIKEAIDNSLQEGDDVTSRYLTNANFETTTGANTGWIVKKASGGNVAYGGNNDNHCFEAWNNSDFDIYQEVENAAIGVYTIQVQGFYRYGRGADAYTAYQNGTAAKFSDAVKLYVNDNTASFKSVFDEPVPYGSYSEAQLYEHISSNGPYVTPDSAYWFPNDMSQSAIAFANGKYIATSFGVVAKKGDKLRIGVKGNTSQLGDSWAIWDDFKVTYQGTNADIVRPFLEQKIAEVKNLVNQDRIYGPSALAAANKAIADGQEAAQGTEGSAMFASLTALIEEVNALNDAALVFDTLTTKNDDLQTAILRYPDASDAAIAAASDLYDVISEHLANKDIDVADARGYFAQIDKAISGLRLPKDYASATEDSPVDMTSMITNPGFDENETNSFNGWTGPGYNFGNDDTQKGALMVEYYNKTFNLHQTIQGLPAGYYRVGVSAFYRFGSTAEDYEKYTADPNTVGNAVVYAIGTDSVASPVALLASGASEDKGISGTTAITNTDLVVPNDMVSAHSYFLDGLYKNSVLVHVGEDGTLTMGMSKGENVANDWVILDSWTLQYLGTSVVNSINGVADKNNFGTAVVSEVYTLNGTRVSGLQRGVNIVKLKDANGNTTVKKIIVR